VRRLTEKELDKEEKKERARELSGVMGRYSQICTFLAGIFFTCILLVLQQKEKFDYDVGLVTFRIHALEMVSVPLTITFLLFVFDAFIFATASQSAEDAKLYRSKAVHLFDLGFNIHADFFVKHISPNKYMGSYHGNYSANTLDILLDIHKAID
jgi:hypothetical protein